MVMLPAAAVGIILSPVAGAAFDKFGPRGVGIGGLTLMTISLGLLGTINTRTSVLFVAVFCALQASGQAIANMPINTWGVNALPNDMIAHATPSPTPAARSRQPLRPRFWSPQKHP